MKFNPFGCLAGGKLDTIDKEYSISIETIDALNKCWRDPGCALNWDCFFVVPPWLDVWWRVFGDGWTPWVTIVKHRGKRIGIAPLMVQGKTAQIIGSPEVCDYLDFPVAPGRGQEVLRIVIRHLKQHGISLLDLGPLRADTSLFADVASEAESQGYDLKTELEDVTLEMSLPVNWEEFLQNLSGKQRHEIRRKLRRLNEAGHVKYRVFENKEEVNASINTFLDLFGSAHSQKKAFMTTKMAEFFRSLTETMTELHILKLFFMSVDNAPAAAAICFDYNNTMYLYNNGYDDRFRSLSVGLLSKIFSIRESIETGRKRFEFLKGNEPYKYRLGGEPVSLCRCKLKID